MASDLERAAERGNFCSVREAKAAGLTAEYFGAKGFKGAALLTRQEGPIDADWPVLGKDVRSPVRSARWRGWVRPPFTGSFGFHVDIPGAQISIAGKRLTSADDKMNLHAGRYHPVQIELPELPAPTDAAVGGYPPLKLSWTTPFGARYLVPKAVLFPPSDTVDRTVATPKAVAPQPGS
jgi:PA14 domain